MRANGQIDAVSIKKDNKYAIRIGDRWFNGFGKLPAEKGDTIELEYGTNNNFNNISKIISVNGASYLPEKAKEKGMDIAGMSKLKNAINARMCALNNATQLAIARNENGIPSTNILEEAKEFVKFIEDVV